MLCRYAFPMVLAVACFGCSSSDDFENQKCEVVTSYVGWELSRLVNEKLVFATEDIELDTKDASKLIIDELIQTDWLDLRGMSPWSQQSPYETTKKTAAEINLLRSFLADANMQNAVPSCSSLRESLRQASIMTGRDAIEQAIAQTDKNTEQYSRTIATSFMPVLSEDGHSAMLFASRTYAGLAGGGLIIKIERQKSGKWVPTRAQVLWVS